MIAYASRTGTLRNVEVLRNAGWCWMLSAKGQVTPLRCGMRYAVDNGAWWAFQNEKPFDVAAFEFAVERFGPEADFIVVPDIVMGGTQSLELSRAWHRDLSSRSALASTRLMIAVQNGFSPADVVEVIGPRCGVFVGGDTDWKLQTMGTWAQFAHEHDAQCHVGRVNTVRRINLCLAANADSFDGSGASKFAKTVAPLDAARRQIDLEGYLARRAA